MNGRVEKGVKIVNEQSKTMCRYLVINAKVRAFENHLPLYKQTELLACCIKIQIGGFYIRQQALDLLWSESKSDGRWKRRHDQRRKFLTEVFRPSDSKERSGEGGDCGGFRSFRGFYLLSRWPANRPQSEKPILIVGREKVRDFYSAREDVSRRSIFQVA